MHILLTGATGFIGSRILPELLAAGHRVTGLTRSAQGARRLAAAGARAHHGTLEDPAGIAAAAAGVDAVIHTAFDHDFANFAANCAKDQRVIAAIGAELKGSDRPLLITSGTGIGDPGDGGPATEDVFDPHHRNPRIASELAGQALLDAGVNLSVMRLPQVHDTVRQGLISPYIEIAVRKGAVAYIGEGGNRWPAAHVSDVARLYALAIDAAAPGARYNAVAEEGITARAIAGVVSTGLDLPMLGLSPEAATEHFGWFAMFAGTDMPASSTLTRARTAWQPTGPGLIADLADMDYAVFRGG